MVSGCHIDFDVDSDSDIIQNQYRSTHVNQAQTGTLQKEIEKLVEKGVIEECHHCEGEWISTVFLRSKKNGEFRMILNLSELNKLVTYKHFKMDTLQAVISLMKPGCFMASVDIKDAYYSVPIAHEHRKFLRFLWQGKVYQYTCLPNGLACAPRKFTKLLKPVFSKLRLEGHTVAGYIDDTYLQGDTSAQCKAAVDRTVSHLEQLGFCIHKEKSMFEPSRSLTFLGFVLNSDTMTVTLTTEKAATIKSLCTEMLHKEFITIQKLAVLIGKLVASFPGVEFGQMHYRCLERGKQRALVSTKGDFSGHTVLTQDMREEIVWWHTNVEKSKKQALKGSPDIEISTDASKEGWGCAIGEVKTGGRFTVEESLMHINCLEILAVLYSLKACLNEANDVHILVKSDNTTTVTYLNNMGGSRAPDCDRLAKRIWEWAIDRNIWISATHIPGATNVSADKESRVFNDATEWQLNSEVFHSLEGKFGQFCIDLFASRLNAQLECFVAWKPDPLAQHVDAFSLNWGKFKLAYIFPPFSLLQRCLQKVTSDQAEAVIVAPHWPTQVWFSRMASMLIDQPLLLPGQEALLKMPVTGQLHPLRKKMRLMACRISGTASKPTEFRTKLLTSSCRAGGLVHTNSTTLTYGSGWNIVAEGVVIPFTLL